MGDLSDDPRGDELLDLDPADPVAVLLASAAAFDDLERARSVRVLQRAVAEAAGQRRPGRVARVASVKALVVVATVAATTSAAAAAGFLPPPIQEPLDRFVGRAGDVAAELPAPAGERPSTPPSWAPPSWAPAWGRTVAPGARAADVGDEGAGPEDPQDEGLSKASTHRQDAERRPATPPAATERPAEPGAAADGAGSSDAAHERATPGTPADPAPPEQASADDQAPAGDDGPAPPPAPEQAEEHRRDAGDE